MLFFAFSSRLFSTSLLFFKKGNGCLTPTIPSLDFIELLFFSSILLLLMENSFILFITKQKVIIPSILIKLIIYFFFILPPYLDLNTKTIPTDITIIYPIKL